MMRILFLKFCFIVWIALMSLITSQAQVSITGSTGADGSYTNLRLAFAAINANGAQGGNNIVITISASITDNSTALLNHPITSIWNSLTIYPTGSGYTLNGSFAGPLFDFNGADFVTFDGRVNGVGTTKDLIITNTSTSSAANTCTFRFIADAKNNTIQYCTIKGSTNATSGVIYFSTAAAGGNDNNTIIDCNLTTDGATRPYNIVYSFGTAGQENSGNTIRRNNIYDFLSQGAASQGILISTNNDNWTIVENHFYQTVSFVPTGSFVHKVIAIADGDNNTISDNFIGGNTAACGGFVSLLHEENSPYIKTNLLGC